MYTDFIASHLQMEEVSLILEELLIGFGIMN